jgi:choline dehydrogenase-like flavoprotein
MIISLDERAAGEVIECDLCIAGSGAAGLSIALQYIDQRDLDVVVLEGGGRDFTEASQEIYQGRNLGLPYYDLDVSRLRYLGGSTNHWGGWCRPLDPMDFEELPWVPHSGWPIGPEDLSVYRAGAHDILDLGDVEYAAEKLVERPDGLFPFNPKLLEHKVWRFSTPTNFGSKYAADLDRTEAVKVCLNANVTNIELSADGRRAVGLDVSTTGEKRLQVRSRTFVLAMGGLETPRILLNSNTLDPKGVGNEHDVVGRYFMEHPHVDSTHLVIGANIDTGFAYSHAQDPQGDVPWLPSLAQPHRRWKKLRRRRHLARD